MFISKQFRNFAHRKSVELVFSNCIFEIKRANSIQISFCILEILPKKLVARLKLYLLRLRMNAKNYSLKCQQIIYCVTTAFAKKWFLTQFCKVCSYVFHSNFCSKKCFSFKLLLNVVVIFSK